MYYVVKRTCILCYGVDLKAYVGLRVNQRWKLKGKPHMPHYPWWTLERKGTVINVMPDNFLSIFKAKEGEEDDN